MTVAEIRAAAIAERKRMNADDVAERGARIERRVLSRIEPTGVEAVYCYVSDGNEVPTVGIIASLLSKGVRIAAPIVTADSPNMQLREINDLSTLEVGRWGIKTPPKDAPPVDPREVTIALTPCVAVDPNGNRIGRGGGFHDRFFAEHPHIIKLGLAFDSQRVSPFVPQAWDIALDGVVTESEFVAFSRRIAVNDGATGAVVMGVDATNRRLP